MSLERRKSAIDRADDLLLVGVGVVGVLFALKILGWVIGTVLFAVKAAVVVLVVMAIVRLVQRRH